MLISTFSQVWAGPDEGSMQKILNDVARAITDFPKTRDIRSILRFYADDFIGIDDGEWYNLKDMEKWLSDLQERMNKGGLVIMSNKVSNIDVHIVGTLGWVTYINQFKLVSGGQIEEDSQSKCTTIFQKKDSVWLIQHEHCSMPQKETDV